MREILFRGKAANRKDGHQYRTRYKNGDWVYGLLTNVKNYAGFSEMSNEIGISGIEVDPATVGQFTGLTDKNGKRIFEGDIIEWRINSESKDTDYGYIVFNEVDLAWCVHWSKYVEDFLSDMQTKYISVVGNVHDNPEFLE